MQRTPAHKAFRAFTAGNPRYVASFLMDRLLMTHGSAMLENGIRGMHLVVFPKVDDLPAPSSSRRAAIEWLAQKTQYLFVPEDAWDGPGDDDDDDDADRHDAYRIKVIVSEINWATSDEVDRAQILTCIHPPPPAPVVDLTMM